MREQEGAEGYEAIALYEQALELAPKDPQASAARNNLGALFLARGETARALFEAGLAADPYNVEARFNAALIHADAGRRDDALRLLEEAAKIAPNHEQVNLRLGLLFLDLERGEDAYRCLLLVRRLHPANWSAALGLAVLHARAEQPDPVRAMLEDALARGGDEARAAARAFPILAPMLGE